MTEFKPGDRVIANGRSMFGNIFNNAHGTVVGPANSASIRRYSDYTIEVSMDDEEVRRNFKPSDLTKENNMNENKNAADLLRRRAANYWEGSIVHKALIDAANELDPPKPKVEVKHSVLEPYKVFVTFERKEDAKAVSHFLYRADHLIDDIYNDQPKKQEVVRAFVDAWHHREGK